MPTNDGLYIGIMSGTSLDGVDVALVEAGHSGIRLVATHSHPLPATLRDSVLALCQSGNNELERAGILHLELGKLFAAGVQSLLDKTGTDAGRILAVGSHGQTIRHLPALGFTVQLGSADVIATTTGIPVVADFRNHDMVLGGQGAPLVPEFHRRLFAKAGERRVVVNIGGMANVSLLDGDTLEGGFDTGPGNVLMNHWAHVRFGQEFDIDGKIAASGKIIPRLLDRWLADGFFQTTGPKSTGREKFNATWLEQHLTGAEAATDVMATLAELTALSIATAIKNFSPRSAFCCGGGAHNTTLLKRLGELLPDARVSSTATLGWDPDWIEAACFAWLAWARLNKLPSTSPVVTGAIRAAVTGAIYHP